MIALRAAPLSSIVALVAFVDLLTACASHEPRQSAPPAFAQQPRRCALRLVSGRILVDGEPVPRATAVERCKQMGEAVVYLEDPALCDEWSAIEADFRGARTRVYVSGPTDSSDGRQIRIPMNGSAAPWEPLPRTCPDHNDLGRR